LRQTPEPAADPASRRPYPPAVLSLTAVSAVKPAGISSRPRHRRTLHQVFRRRGSHVSGIHSWKTESPSVMMRLHVLGTDKITPDGLFAYPVALVTFRDGVAPRSKVRACRPSRFIARMARRRPGIPCLSRRGPTQSEHPHRA